MAVEMEKGTKECKERGGGSPCLVQDHLYRRGLAKQKNRLAETSQKLRANLLPLPFCQLIAAMLMGDIVCGLYK